MSDAPSQPAGRTGAGEPQAVPSTGGRTTSAQVAQWADQLSERVIDGVGWLRSRTTVPVVRALRAIVYGFAAAIALLTAAVLGLIAAVRIWDAYVPVQPLGRRVWLGYSAIGGLLFLAGVALLARRSSARDKP